MKQDVSGRWAEVEPILDRALELDLTQRREYLATACGSDQDLRQAVTALLAADEAADDFFTTGDALISIAQPSPSPVGTLIGPYRLLESIGEGGMGRIFLAERVDGDFEQQVAIKFLSLSIDPKAQQRFQTECQNLARLDHPNIVHLLDGGTADNGASYLVLQHIDGEPIDRFAQSRTLNLDQRLNLFAQLCQAVQYAHRNLIVHRDLKPSNVLVTDQGQVKLLDFGISHDLGVDETATSSLMTPRYAAPEQILGQSITTATDIYGLGCVLHELLTGVPPFANEDSSIESLVARARRVEPPRPSSLDSGLGSGLGSGMGGNRGSNGGGSGSSKRRTEYLIDSRRLQGDLDAILMKCLQSEPSLRYGSAAELLQDIQAHLDGYPVRARPTSGVTRFTRFLKRHWLVTASLASVFVVGVAATAFHIQSITRERGYANATAQFLEDLLFDVKPTERNEQNTLVLPITRFYELGLERIADSPMPITNKLDLIKYFAAGFTSADDYAGAIKATEMAERLLAAEAPNSYDHLSAIFSRAVAYTNLCQYDLARADYQRLVAAIGHQLEPVSQAAALSWNDFAVLERRVGNYQVAESYIAKAIELIEQIPNKGGVSNHTALLRNQSEVLLNLGRLSEAHDILNQAIEIRDQHYTEGHYRRAVLYALRGRVFDAQGLHDEAKVWHDKAVIVARHNLGDNHADTLKIRAHAAHNLLALQQPQAAKTELQDIVAQAESSLQMPAREPAAYLYLARALYQSGELVAARAAVQSGLAVYQQNHSGDHPQMALLLMVDAAIATDQKQSEQARQYATEAVEVSRRLPTDHYLRQASAVLLAALEKSCSPSNEMLRKMVKGERQRWQEKETICP